MLRAFNYALILTHNRPCELENCVTRVAPQVDAILIYDNDSQPRIPNDSWDGFPTTAVNVFFDPHQPPNIGRMWNIGLDYIERAMHALGATRWNVAMLCDDIELPSDWMSRVSYHMRAHGATAASAHHVRPIEQPILHRQPDGDIMNRMHGAAFVLAGEQNVRADETMKWWWVDTDLDWQARGLGGTVIAPGAVAVNTRPNDFTNSKPELGAQAGRDGETFAAKWGWRPW